jgi:GNAT superfamily N-acetyltransferase
MNRPMVFRFAVTSDVEALLDLVESAYRGQRSRAGWTTEADMLEGQRTDRAELEQLIADPGARIVLALEPSESGSADPGRAELLGCVLGKSEGEGVVHIGLFAVRPTAQARGVGRVLLEEVERVARVELGASTAKMTVIEQRLELIAWYARRGYAATGKTEPFPYGNARFGIPLRADLRFVVLAKALRARA